MNIPFWFLFGPLFSVMIVYAYETRMTGREMANINREGRQVEYDEFDFPEDGEPEDYPEFWEDDEYPVTLRAA